MRGHVHPANPSQAQHKGMISHFNIPMATVMLVVRCVVETQAHVQGDRTERLKLDRNLAMQQDNNPKHTSKSTTDRKNKRITVLRWPSQSLDLNPTEML